MNEKFTIELCSDLDYEEMVADVSYENHTVAIITQEQGPENMEIEIYPPDGEVSLWKFSLNDLIYVMQLAKKKLIESQKISE